MLEPCLSGAVLHGEHADVGDSSLGASAAAELSDLRMLLRLEGPSGTRAPWVASWPELDEEEDDADDAG